MAVPALVAVSTTVPAPLIVATLLATATMAGLALTKPTGNFESLLAESRNVALLEKTCADGWSNLIVCGALAITKLALLLPW